LNEVTGVVEEGAGQDIMERKTADHTQRLVKAEQKMMRFCSNPYYVMRNMGLPILGSLVSPVAISLH
jgi:hypothetical protein